MSLLEIVSRLCDITNNLSDIVKKQQVIIEQSKIEAAVTKELRQWKKEIDRELDVIEYHSRRYADIDDIEETLREEGTIDD
jgi:flagellar biosynthesis/type III secretory pathway chaperone